MDPSSNIDRFVDELLEVRRALEEGEREDALALLLEVRESGLFSEGLDACIDEMREAGPADPIDQTRSWLNRQLEGAGESGGAFESEHSDPSDSDREGEVSDGALGAMGGASEVDRAYEEFPRERSGGDFRLEGEDPADPSGSRHTEPPKGDERGFSREARSLTAVGHENLSDLDSDEVQARQRNFEGADPEFERLPSIDFAMVESGEISFADVAALEASSSHRPLSERAPSEGGDAISRSENGGEFRETERNPAVSEIEFGEEVAPEMVEDSASEDSVSEDSVSENLASENSASEDLAPEASASEESKGNGEGGSKSRPFDFSAADTAQEAAYWDSAVHERDEALDEALFAEEPEEDDGDDEAFERELSEVSEEFFDDDFEDGGFFEESEELSEISEVDVLGEESQSPQQEGDSEGGSAKYEPNRTIQGRPSSSVRSSSPDMEDPELEESSTRPGFGESVANEGGRSLRFDSDESAPFAAPGRPEEDRLSESSQSTPETSDTNYSPGQIEPSSGVDEEFGDPTSTGRETPLSDEEFFGLAEELSEVSTAEDAGAGTLSSESGATGATVAYRTPPQGEGAGEQELDERAESAFGEKSEPADEFDAENRIRRETRGPDDGIEESIRLLEEAEQLVEQEQFDSAHDLVQSILDRNPNSERARSLLSEIERERGPSEPVELGSLDEVPERNLGLDEIQETDLDHRAGFVLSLVDGELTFEDILDLSSMPRSETLEVLSKMLEKSVISVGDE